MELRQDEAVSIRVDFYVKTADLPSYYPKENGKENAVHIEGKGCMSVITIGRGKFATPKKTNVIITTSGTNAEEALRLHTKLVPPPSAEYKVVWGVLIPKPATNFFQTLVNNLIVRLLRGKKFLRFEPDETVLIQN